MKTESSGIFGFVSFDFENLNHEPKTPQGPFEKDSLLLTQCSCDGLILVSVLVKDPDGSFEAELKCNVRTSLILWNPSIGLYKRISCPHEITFSSRLGLGYDSAVDDYRVFVVSRENETSVMVYNSRNDSWNIFIDNRYVLSSWTHPAVLNGAVHWVMCPYESVSCVIVYFDLVEEKFKEVPPPSSWKKDDEMRLVVLGEQLCVYCDIDVKQIEVYAMKEYGNKESWTRLFVIPCGILKSIHVCNQNCTCTAVRPLCLTKNGQVLIQVGSWVVGNYDPKDSAFLSFDSERGWMPLPYVETLISPGGGV
ncbi:hypothetical protein Vadar_017274 [Vaccinium darrowii]|uniref:Uncharacterized protein n=1 Tax=Vaccinium darrowii TaxID=229202 RepID=A0ACB7X1Y4_9ERIC|nr:hypothetical protein Vadar_017274 [Vaccinium darrowii]